MTSGCASNAVSVTVNAPVALPSTPSVSNLIYCQNATAIPLTATGTNLKWYTTATGGTSSTTAPIPSTAIIGMTNYYVSQTNTSGCESPRATLTVTINQCGFVDSDCDGVSDENDVCPGGNDLIDSNNDGKPDCKYPPAFSAIIAAWKCDNNNQKILISHDGRTQCIAYSAAAAHIAHGDYIGPANNASCSGQALMGQIGNGQNFAVYPNPAESKVFVLVEAHEVPNWTVQIFNLAGQAIFTQKGEGDNLLDINTEGFPNGLYFVHFNNGIEKSVTKLLIQH